MKISYRLIERGGRIERDGRTIEDGSIVEEMCFDKVCCGDMKKAMLSQETLFAKTTVSVTWLYCPFCKKEIEY